jgi:hypothetical protein
MLIMNWAKAKEPHLSALSPQHHGSVDFVPVTKRLCQAGRQPRPSEWAVGMMMLRASGNRLVVGRRAEVPFRDSKQGGASGECGGTVE